MEGLPSTPVSTVKRYTNLDTAVKPPRELRRSPSDHIDCLRVLRDVFGKQSFKGKQKEIVEAALTGVDIFVSAPTGMGKSLCFQLPAVADPNAGLTIVVSPLLALMTDQVLRLRESGIRCESWTSQTTATERAELVKDLSQRVMHLRLLYITPEKLLSREVSSLLEDLNINGQLNRLVVDEAHCISEWGHDFREEYRKLGHFRQRYPHLPVTALTASATPAVREDIIDTLHLSRDHLFSVTHPFNRENLFYEIRHLPFTEPFRQYELIHSYIHTITSKRGEPVAGIIYARARATCDELADYLRQRGVAARPYHRGISRPRLDRTLQEWSANTGLCEVVCCTVAFGMGIDKPDVRYVIHFDLPKSFEGFYQETGRAGRDGEVSKCILYYAREDAVKVRYLVQKSQTARSERELDASQRAPNSLEALVKFAESTDVCRHILICRYFGETIDEGNEKLRKVYCDNMCDICKNPGKVSKKKSELSSDQWISSQMSKLTSEADINEVDNAHEAGQLRPLRFAPPRHSGPERLELNTPPIQTPAYGGEMSSLTSVELPANDAVRIPQSDSVFPRSRVDQRPAKRPRLSSGASRAATVSLRNGPIPPKENDFADGAPPRGKENAPHPLLISSAPDYEPPPMFLGNYSPAARPSERSRVVVSVGSRKVSSGKGFQTPWAAKRPPRQPEATGSPLPPPPINLSPPNHASPSDPREEAEDSTAANGSKSPRQSRSTGEIADPETCDDIEDSEGGSLSPTIQSLLNDHLEVDAHFSEKVDLEVRDLGVRMLLRCFERVLVESQKADAFWASLSSSSPKSLDSRARLARDCAVQMEFSCFSFAKHQERYERNVRDHVRSMRKLIKAYGEGSRGSQIKDEQIQALIKVLQRAL